MIWVCHLTGVVLGEAGAGNDMQRTFGQQLGESSPDRYGAEWIGIPEEQRCRRLI